jgi:histidinol dehydrogenase
MQDMEIYNEPPREQWVEICSRPVLNNTSLSTAVGEVLLQVKQLGDVAVRDATFQFDSVRVTHLQVSDQEVEESLSGMDKELKEAIDRAYDNIYKFHQAQVAVPEKIETMPGVVCWRKSVGIEKVGIYIPGGTAPLFSTVLMLGVPAQIAGCKEIILCSPPNINGQLHPAILYAARKTGVTRIFRIGGVQAIAAMAYGTESVPKVFKIFGPGNQYVMAAKQQVQLEGTAIDMPAGPSEVCVWCDESANPIYVAADLLSQAEHGVDSQVMLIANSEKVALRVKEEVIRQLSLLSRHRIAEGALRKSRIVVLSDPENALEMIDLYAPEHLIINAEQAEDLAEKVINAGSIFIGPYTPESVGDYASGTNHTLPTNGFAKAYSGVSVDSFVKKITLQHLSREGLKNISSTVITMAEAEGLQAHAEAVRVRLLS